LRHSVSRTGSSMALRICPDISSIIHDLRSAAVLFGMSLNGFCAGQFHRAGPRLRI
jgi:hypothetical protein